MKLVLAITTYNRIAYLRQTMTSWQKTRNGNHQWCIIVADDGSYDGTLQYLQSVGDLTLITSYRRGIHHQTNQILRICEKLDFDVCFKIDDDMVFKQSGWDDKYVEAIMQTKYDHLVFHDPQWKRVKRKREPIVDKTQLLECQAYWNDAQGAFWTFTPEVLKKVGYFDIHNFGLCGHGHRDFTYRCCKSGFNVFDNIFDVRNSNEYITLIKENYKSSPGRDQHFAEWNDYKHKFVCFSDDRIYIPYNEIQVDLFRNPILKIL